MKRYILLFLFFIPTLIFAQSTIKKNWDINISAGADFTGLIRSNPKVGSGDNQISFSGAFSGVANYQTTRTSWTNFISLNYGIQKTGFSSLPNSNIRTPFQKSVDQFRIESKWGYRSSILYPGAKFLYSADFTFTSQVSNTYSNSFLTQPDPLLVEGKIDPISKFLSPATLYLSLGIDYKPTDQLSFYYSPGALKNIIVLNDNIADSIIIDDNNLFTSLHGNPVKLDEEGFPISYKNVDFQIGSLIKVAYNDAFFQKRLFINSRLTLFSNYLNRPEKVDIDWNNEIGFNIFEGFQISLWTNVFYDYDIPVKKTENLQILEGQFTRGVSLTQQLFLKYSVTF